MKEVLENPIFKLILSLILMLAGILLPISNTFKLVLYLLSYVVIGYKVIIRKGDGGNFSFLRKRDTPLKS